MLVESTPLQKGESCVHTGYAVCKYGSITVYMYIVYCVPYSLKFSRLKNFADFVGLSVAAKIFFREISTS